MTDEENDRPAWGKRDPLEVEAKMEWTDFNLEALAPEAQAMYAHLTECLWPAEQKMMLSLLRLAFYQGANAGANEMHKQAKEILNG